VEEILETPRVKKKERKMTLGVNNKAEARQTKTV